MRKFLFILLAFLVITFTTSAKTLVVFYSFTNNVKTIVDELKTQIECDVIEIIPAEKGLDYAANNYAIGSAQIGAINSNPDAASSYPAIDPVKVNLTDYDTVIIGAPLWWSHMAAPLQSYLFSNGPEMAGKKVGLIVSSSSSGISSVVADAKRLIPDSNFLEPNLWIRSSQVSDSHALIQQWLKDIDYPQPEAGITELLLDRASASEIFDLNGMKLANSNSRLHKGIYIVRQSDKTIKVRL